MSETFLSVFWKSLSPMQKRMLTIGVFLVISMMVTLAGTMYPLSTEEANDIDKSFNQTMDALESMPPSSQATYIFGNNVFICLLAFIPIIGAFLEFYILFSTGVTIAAITYNAANPSLSFLLLFIFPFTWLEFIAYSIGISEGVWLFWRIIKHRGKRELLNACTFIAISVVLLLAAAFIEIAIIAALS